MARLIPTRTGFAPLKGTRHLGYAAVELDTHGPVGDRRFCLVDVEDRRVLKTVQNPTLVAVLARVDAGRLDVTLPDGTAASAVPEPTGERIECEYWGRPVDLELLAGPFDALVSDHLGTPVRLAAAPAGGVVFADPITVVTTASLRAAGDAVGTKVDPARFRPTFVVESDEPYAEEQWLGREFDLGDARIRIGAPIPRCAVIDLDPETGVKDVRLLRSLAAERPLNTAGEPCFGVFAQVVTPGVVAAHQRGCTSARSRSS